MAIVAAVKTRRMMTKDFSTKTKLPVSPLKRISLVEYISKSKTEMHSYLMNVAFSGYVSLKHYIHIYI